MNTMLKPVLWATTLATAISLAACGGGGGGGLTSATNSQAAPSIAVGEPHPGSGPVLEPFVTAARAAPCADLRNRLFVIDKTYVFADVAGNCSDASYSQTLYGATPDKVLCSAYDSIAGPRSSCTDAKLTAMFDTMRKNLDQKDLGLGKEHTVEQHDFLPADGQAVAALEIAAESFSQIHAPRTAVVRTQAEWARLWAEHTGKNDSPLPAPKIDFAKQMLVAVFAGDTMACQDFGVGRVLVSGGKLAVEYFDSPRPDFQVCLAVVTQPMRVVAVPRSEGEVKFVKVTAGLLSQTDIGMGAYSGIEEKRQVVVRDAAAWEALLKAHGGDSKLPEVDFGREMVVGVFMGMAPGGCHATGVRGIYPSDGKLVVSYYERYPVEGQEIACTKNITFPYHLVVVPRSDLPAVFAQVDQAFR
jgi:hypothetical protein